MDEELKLLHAWRAGDLEAGDRLLVRYHKLIWRTVATKIPEHAVEDLVQEVIVALIKRRDTLESDAKFRSYALAVTRNVIQNFIRKRYQRPVDLAGTMESSVQELGMGPSSIVLAKQQHRMLLDALRSLPLDDQFVLELYYWEGMTGPELGAVFDILEPTVRGRLRRAKKRLDERMGDLAKQHQELAETMTTFESWAAGVREAIDLQGLDRGE